MRRKLGHAGSESILGAVDHEATPFVVPRWERLLSCALLLRARGFYASHYDYLRAMGVPGAKEVQCDVQDPRFKSFSSSAMLGAACLVVSPASLLVRWLLRKATSRDIMAL